MNSKPPTDDSRDLGATILKGACNAEAKDLSIELAEAAVDNFLDEGILKEIPILKSIVACRKTWETIHDQLFLRKVARFLASCPKFDDLQKSEFIREHLHDPEKRRRLADAVVLILDKLDDMQKPEMLAKIFAAFVRKRIDYADFRRLATGIAAAFVDDLKILAANPSRPEIGSEKFLRLLEPAGFVSTGGGVTRMNAAGTRTDINPLGRLFQKCMQEQPDECPS